MSAKTLSKPKKDLSSRQHAFLKSYAKGKTLKQAAIEAGYSKKNADQPGYQALKAMGCLEEPGIQSYESVH